mgnify:FL=1
MLKQVRIEREPGELHCGHILISILLYNRDQCKMFRPAGVWITLDLDDKTVYLS